MHYTERLQILPRLILSAEEMLLSVTLIYPHLTGGHLDRCEQCHDIQEHCYDPFWSAPGNLYINPKHASLSSEA